MLLHPHKFKSRNPDNPPHTFTLLDLFLNYSGKHQFQPSRALPALLGMQVTSPRDASWLSYFQKIAEV